MTQEEKQALLGSLFQGANMAGAQIIALNEGKVYYQEYASGPAFIRTEDEPRPSPGMAEVAQAVAKCKPFLWGNSALAVVFAVCRDEYGLGDNMSQFERQLQEQGVECPAGTIANALKNNPYMKKPVERWRTNGAQERAMVLVSEFRKSIDGLQPPTNDTEPL